MVQRVASKQDRAAQRTAAAGRIHVQRIQGLRACGTGRGNVADLIDTRPGAKPRAVGALVDSVIAAEFVARYHMPATAEQIGAPADADGLGAAVALARTAGLAIDLQAFEL